MIQNRDVLFHIIVDYKYQKLNVTNVTINYLREF